MGGEIPGWEYRMVEAHPGLELGALGRDGWELVAALPVGGVPTLFFKRPLPGFRERVTLDQKREVYARFGLALPDVEGPQA